MFTTVDRKLRNYDRGSILMIVMVTLGLLSMLSSFSIIVTTSFASPQLLPTPQDLPVTEPQPVKIDPADMAKIDEVLALLKDPRGLRVDTSSITSALKEIVQSSNLAARVDATTSATTTTTTTTTTTATTPKATAAAVAKKAPQFSRRAKLGGVLLTGNPKIPPIHERQFQYNSTWDFTEPLKQVGTGGCCGLGHRLSRTIPGLAYALRHQRRAIVYWGDTPWSAFFEETPYVQCERALRQRINTKPRPQENFSNQVPKNFDGVERANEFSTVTSKKGDVYLSFQISQRILMTNLESGTVLQHMMDNLKPIVTDKLVPVQKQVQPLHMCAHFRLGNGETGNWEGRKWRHVNNKDAMMGMVLEEMIKFSKDKANSEKTEGGVSLFVAGDDPNIQGWFQNNVPTGWKVIMPEVDTSETAKRLPESGVWFGDFKSNTSAILTPDEKNDKMAEAMADMILLGQCDGLFAPTYSSFIVLPIMMSYVRDAAIFIRNREEFEPFRDDPFKKP